jgi:SAM-dependent methyltransferase
MAESGSHSFETCRFCRSKNVHLVMDFGTVAIAGAFLTPAQFDTEPKIPMRVVFCSDCYLLQIKDRVPPELLFSDYFYFSSAISTLRDHFRGYAAEVTKRFLKPESATVLEIGCNDGVLVNPFAELGIKTVIGVDPATNVVKTVNNPKVHVVNDFFSEAQAEKIRKEFGPVDLIAANNVYAHLDDMHDVTRGIEKLLAPDGVFVFEVHYIKNLLQEKQYDMIYHEHLFYYSLLALDNFLAQFNMEIFDVKPIAIHAGSMRYYVRRKGHLKSEKISDAVIALRAEERANRYDHLETYLDYARSVAKTKENLMHLLGRLVAEKKKIFGYGASGRANTLIQYCGITNKMLDCIIDDAPAKHGFYTPGSHIEILSREEIRKENPDYVLVFAWSFIKEIAARNIDYLERGGKFIVPLPEVQIVTMKNGEIVWERPAEYNR